MLNFFNHTCITYVCVVFIVVCRSVDIYASLALQQGIPADLMVVHLVCGISVTLYHGFALF